MPTPRPLRADARRNRDAILDAARAVFADEGVLAPIDGIAARAAVGNATLYRHFPTRDDLLVAVMDASFDAAVAEASALSARLGPREALTEWLVYLTWQLRIWHDLPTCLATAHEDDDSPIQTACNPLIIGTTELLTAAGVSTVTGEEVYQLVLALSWSVDRFGDDEPAARRRVTLATAGLVTAAPGDPVLTRPLRTERLLLRPAVPEDADLTWPYRRLESASRWTGGGASEGLPAYRAMFAEPDRLRTTVIVEHPDLGVVGDLMIRVGNGWAQRERREEAVGVEAELGWFIDPSHAGQGYATEAARELVRYAFADLGLRRLTAACFLANTPSWRLMERLGMRREAHAVRESLHASGEWLDSLTYALLAEEWTG